jgi:hypothetical protein
MHAISSELTAIEGPLEVYSVYHMLGSRYNSHIPLQSQQEQVTLIQARIPRLSDTLANVAKAEAECSAANVEENDYTVFTCQDLEFELELVVQSIAKKIAFIHNQVCCRLSKEPGVC